LLLVPYGSLFFATAPLFNKQLPDVTDESFNSVVMIGLRGNEELGSTFLKVLSGYADDLRAHNCKLMLVGVNPDVVKQLQKTGLMRQLGTENIYPEADQIGGPALAAWEAAERWIAEQPENVA
jgi:SulP family sulfate permease